MGRSKPLLATAGTIETPPVDVKPSAEEVTTSDLDGHPLSDQAPGLHRVAAAAVVHPSQPLEPA
jgi:hypothetical protein